MKQIVIALGLVAVLVVGSSASRTHAQDIWVLTAHTADGGAAVADSYTQRDRALRAAQVLDAAPDTWVTVDPSFLHGVPGNGQGWHFGLLLFPELHAAQTLTTTSALVLPGAVRTGEFVSPQVLLPPDVPTYGVSFQIPAAQLTSPSWGLMAWIEETQDGGATWNLQCGFAALGPAPADSLVFVHCTNSFRNVPVRAHAITCYQPGPLPVNGGLVCTPTAMDVGATVEFQS